MKNYDEYNCFGIGRCLFLILKLTKNKYNLNEVQEYILTQNMSIVLDKYSKLVKTDDLDICVYKNSLGDLYTLEIDEDFINNIKLITSGKTNLLYNHLGELIIDDYNLLNHPIFQYDIKKVISDNNISNSDLFCLITYTKNMDLINRYIKLLGSNDPEFNKLLLDFIKPATHYMDNFLYGNNALNYIKDESVVNDYKKCEEFYEKSCASSNLYLIKAFENYFINKIDILEQVLKLNNRCEILKEMVAAKNEILSYKNIYYSIEDTRKNCIKEIVTYESVSGFDCADIEYIDGYFDIKKDEVDRLYKETDDLLQDIVDCKEINKEKLKIRTRKQLDDLWLHELKKY